MPRNKKKIREAMPQGIWITNDGRYHWDLKKRLKDGRTWRRSSDHATLKLAVDSRKRALKDYERVLSGLEPIFGDGTTVGEWCTYCLDNIMPTSGSRRGRPYKLTTLRGYRQLAECYVLPHLGDIKLKYISVSHLDLMMKHLRSNELKISVKNFLSRIFSLAEDREKIAMGSNPCKKLPLRRVKTKRTQGMVVRHYERDPKHSQRLVLVETRVPDGKLIVRKRILSLNEENLLLSFLSEHAEYKLYLTPVLLGLRAGLRISEAIGLEWSNVDLDKKFLRVEQQANYVSGKGVVICDPKSAAGFRQIPLCKSLFEHLCQLKETTHNEYVCASASGSRLEQARYSDRLRRIMYEAGLGHRVEGSFFVRQPTHHDLRRTCLSRMASGNHTESSRSQPAPVHILARFAGHEDAKTLLDYYVATDDKILIQIVADMP